ncbi:MAG: helix-turn-helix transcriptional regulator [Gallionellaceae bacterium]
MSLIVFIISFMVYGHKGTYQTMLGSMKKPSQSLSAREIFCKNLRLARRLKEISQEELAFRADLSRTYVSEVESGSRNISIDNMGLLAQALDVPLRDLVDPEMFTALGQRI